MAGVYSAPLCAGLVLAVSASTAGDVRITGGADASGHRYTWVVTNDGDSPLTYVEFPHYRASLFFVPDGWESDCTFLVNVGVEDKPGVCTAWVDSPVKGIGRHQSAEFTLQIASGDVLRGRGEVVARTASGQQLVVSGVELPQPEPASDKYVSLLGLGLVLFLAIVVQRKRARKPKVPSHRATEG